MGDFPATKLFAAAHVDSAVTPQPSLRTNRSGGDSMSRVRRDDAARLFEATLPTLAKVAMALLGDTRGARAALEKVAERAAEALEGADDDGAARLSLFKALRAECAGRSTVAGPRGTDAPPETERMGASAAARKVLSRLRPTERDALVLMTVGKLDVAAIAEVCGVSEEAARERLTRALAAASEEGER